jgi:hypothetical protein
MTPMKHGSHRWRRSLVWVLAGMAVLAVGLWVGWFALSCSHEAAVQQLVEAVRQRDKAAQLAAASKVRFLRVGELASRELVQLWNEGDWALDLRAAETLNLLGPAAVPALISSIEDRATDSAATPHDLIRWARSVRDPSAIRRLCDAMQGHSNGCVRRAVIDSLATRCPVDEQERWRLLIADLDEDERPPQSRPSRAHLAGSASSARLLRAWRRRSPTRCETLILPCARQQPRRWHGFARETARRGSL